MKPEKKKRMDVAEEAYAASDVADVANQKEILNVLVDIAKDPGDKNWKFAMETLIKHGSFKLPEIKVVEEDKPEYLDVTDSVKLLKAAQLKATQEADKKAKRREKSVKEATKLREARGRAKGAGGE